MTAFASVRLQEVTPSAAATSFSSGRMPVLSPEQGTKTNLDTLERRRLVRCVRHEMHRSIGLSSLRTLTLTASTVSLTPEAFRELVRTFHDEAATRGCLTVFSSGPKHGAEHAHGVFVDAGTRTLKELWLSISGADRFSAFHSHTRPETRNVSGWFWYCLQHHRGPISFDERVIASGELAEPWSRARHRALGEVVLSAASTLSEPSTRLCGCRCGLSIPSWRRADARYVDDTHAARERKRRQRERDASAATGRGQGLVRLGADTPALSAPTGPHHQPTASPLPPSHAPTRRATESTSGVTGPRTAQA